MDYKRNMRYFRRLNLTFPVLISLFGLILLIAGSDDLGAIAIGLLMMIGGVLLGVYYIKLTPTDEEIDQVTMQYLKDIREKSISKLKDSYSDFETQEPIIISDYYFKPVNGQYPFTRMGKDHLYRSSMYSCSVFIFTNHQMVYQKTLFSIVHPLEKTFGEEYYYDDIVTVKTHESVSSNYNQKSQYDIAPQSIQNSFQLVTKGGNKITFSFKQNDKINKVVDYMKKMIRKRKLKKSETVNSIKN